MKQLKSVEKNEKKTHLKIDKLCFVLYNKRCQIIWKMTINEIVKMSEN